MSHLIYYQCYKYILQLKTYLSNQPRSYTYMYMIVCVCVSRYMHARTLGFRWGAVFGVHHPTERVSSLFSLDENCFDFSRDYNMLCAGRLYSPSRTYPACIKKPPLTPPHERIVLSQFRKRNELKRTKLKRESIIYTRSLFTCRPCRVARDPVIPVSRVSRKF